MAWLEEQLAAMSPEELEVLYAKADEKMAGMSTTFEQVYALPDNSRTADRFMTWLAIMPSIVPTSCSNWQTSPTSR
jgi:hypothetical protein